MIKIKLISKTQVQDKYEYILAGQDDQGYYLQKIITYTDKDALILADYTSKMYVEEMVDYAELEDFNRDISVPTNMTVNFYNLTGKVYDQYGSEMETEIQFIIEGENARIEKGKLIEDVVDTDTSYFIVAKVGDLEERQERFLYAPREVEPSEIDLLNKKVELLASENEAKDDLLQEIVLQIYS